MSALVADDDEWDWRASVTWRQVQLNPSSRWAPLGFPDHRVELQVRPAVKKRNGPRWIVAVTNTSVAASWNARCERYDEAHRRAPEGSIWTIFRLHITLEADVEGSGSRRR